MEAPKIRNPLRFSLLFVFAIPVCLSLPAHAVTTNIPLSGSIQTAINAANAGDRLQLAAGTYHQRITLGGKAITLRGLRDEFGNLLTKLDGDAAGTVVIISNGETRSTVLEYLRIENGRNTTSGGGGLYLNGCSPLIRGCLISNCYALNKGGGVSMVVSSPRFEDCTIESNTTDQKGAGVSISLSTGVEFIRCAARYNQAQTLGGAFYLDRSSVLFSECDIYHSGAIQDGGGIYGTEPVGTTIVNSKIWDCEALRNGGGLYMDSANPWEIRDSLVGGNRECVQGAGLYLMGVGAAKLLRNRIVGNRTWGLDAKKGGGVYLHWNSGAVLDGNTIVGNEADSGSGLYVAATTATFKNNIIAFNANGEEISADDGGAVAPDFSYCCVFDTTSGIMSGGLENMLGVRGNFAADPLFIDRVNGDYHLQSAGGHWNPVTSAWVLDAYNSPCLDAGDPTSTFNLEPAPNGGRLNLGSDGNTAYASRTPAPTIGSHTPTSNSTSPEMTAITATFSVPMDKTTAQKALSISPAKAAGVLHGWPGTFSWVGKKMQYKLSTSLAPNTTYIVTIAKTAKSAAGVALAADQVWTFKTSNVPAVTSHAPKGTMVALSTTGKVIKIGFNQAMDKPTVQGALWLYKTGTTPSVIPTLPSGTFSWVGNEMRYTLTYKLVALTSYTVKLGMGAKSSTGVARTGNFIWSFTTGATSTSPSLVTASAAPTASGAQLTLGLTSPADVTVTIRNLAGREVTVLLPGELAAGVKTLLWDGKSRTGTRVPAGTYLVQVTASAADGSSAQALTSLQLR